MKQSNAFLIILIFFKIVLVGLIISKFCSYSISSNELFISGVQNQNLLPFVEIKDYPPIYGLMITGKDDTRIQYAKSAVENYFAQDYPDKRLVIINHREQEKMKVLEDERLKHHRSKCIEICTSKINGNNYSPHKLNLGEMRNMSLQFVPINGLWTIWDDDDWRANNYLTTLFGWLTENKVDCIAYTTRYEHNLSTSFSWKMTLMKGYPTILCRQNPLIRYKPIETMEDVRLIDDIRELGLNVTIIHNEDRPDMYVRLVHGHNTSLYANPVKNSIRKSKTDTNKSSYREDEISDVEREYVLRCVRNIES